MIRSTILQSAWVAANIRRRRSLRNAFDDPARAQESLLSSYLEANRDTAFGREYGFSKIRSVADYQARVPLSDHDDYGPFIDRIRAGEDSVLTVDPVTRLVPSSGSTAARKLIPYTQTLREEFNCGIGPWIAELYANRPALLTGSSYWSITPVVPTTFDQSSAVPVGFDQDSEYLGSWMSRLVDATFAVKSSVSQLRDLTTFRYATLLDLLRARDLSLISVWHPSFLSLLLGAASEHWDALVEGIETGELNAPGEIDDALRSRLRRRADPRRAAELRDAASAGRAEWTHVWPHLGLISCWTDAHARGAASELDALFPGVEVQPKGLVATEAFVTLPLAEGRPLSLRSHFFEFLDEKDHPHLAHELRAGAEYSVVVTTGGGFYRYRMRDRVRVDGFLSATPCLRFLGKEDSVSDRCGEKIADTHVAEVLSRVLATNSSPPAFAMLAPDERADGLGYTLYLEKAVSADPSTFAGFRPDLASRLEQELRRNPHYAYCVDLGQLRPARVFRVSESGHHRYLEARCAEGQRLGDIKPVALSTETGWSERFSGDYLAS